MTWQVLVRGPLLALDERVDRGVVGRGPRSFTEFLADLGNPQVALPVLALALGYALWRGHRLLALAVAAAMAAVPAVVAPLKALIDRPSPLDPAAGGYFPSGHGATAAVAYCGAALLLTVGARGVTARTTGHTAQARGVTAPTTGHTAQARGVTAPTTGHTAQARGVTAPTTCFTVRMRGRWPMAVAFALTVTTGAGLVLRGYHWPLDVLGSWCLALLLLAPARWLTRRPAPSGSPPRAWRAPAPPGR